MEGNIVALLISGIVTAGGLIFSESIKEIITKFFSNLSKGQINFLFFSLLFVVAIVAFVGSSYIAGPERRTDIPTVEINEGTVSESKSKEEVYLEGGKILIDEVQDIAEKKKLKDSVREANRERIWVYQIGLPKSSLNEVGVIYKLLNEKDKIYVFKESKKKYLLVRNNGWSEPTLRDSLQSFKEKIQNIEANVKIVDLMSFCSKRDNIIESRKERIKKEDIEIPCLVCN